MTDSANDPKLDICGCCQDELPKPVLHNPPGQPALDYRIGTHSEFLQRLIARLPKWTIPDGDHQGQRPLARLTTRASEDPAITLLDAWATVGDVLTFYQERIANEGFLRTATERRSVLELARAIGYELAPGVAASTYLAFTVDESEGTPKKAPIPAGTQVQSIPAGGGELPQTFETAAELEARLVWNMLKPRTTERDVISAGKTELYLAGIDTQLQPGDAILIIGPEREGDPKNENWDLRILKTVRVFPEQDYTLVTWEEGLGFQPGSEVLVEPAADETADVYVFRQRAALFGYNAPDWRTMSSDVKKAYVEGESDTLPKEWPDFKQTVDLDDRQIDLDSVYPKVVPDSWIALAQPEYVEVYKVAAVTQAARANFALTAKTTRITLEENAENLAEFIGHRRDTVVYVQAEKRTRAERPLETLVTGNTIDLDGLAEGLQRNQPIIVSGKLDEIQEDVVSEVVFVESLTDHGTGIRLRGDGLEKSYVRSSVKIYANVVPATHGETVADEVLGSGDASQANQRFKLNKPPLTYVSAETASGRQSTLTVRVDGIEWEQKPSLFRLGRDSRSYTVRINNEAQASVIFGDGQSGIRLPTGQENVTATYRSGIGTDGLVGARSLTLLKTRPFGIKSVTNPRAASGAEDPESLSDARQNAPTTVLTLDRIVSLQDYQDFARTFAGIGRARAVALWVGRRELVHLTIAAANGQEIDSESELYQNLSSAIADARDPSQEVRLEGFQPRFFNLEARVLIDSAYRWEIVKGDIEAALRKAFGFQQRTFGQPVSSAEVITVIHGIEGVRAVDLDALYRVDESGQPVGRMLLAVLPARNARPNKDGAAGEPEILPAELLMINESGIALEEMKP